MGDSYITTTGADALGRSTGKNPVLVMIFLENTSELPEIITSTGGDFCEISALQYCTGNSFGSEKELTEYQSLKPYSLKPVYCALQKLVGE